MTPDHIAAALLFLAAVLGTFAALAAWEREHHDHP